MEELGWKNCTISRYDQRGINEWKDWYIGIKNHAQQEGIKMWCSKIGAIFFLQTQEDF